MTTILIITLIITQVLFVILWFYPKLPKMEIFTRETTWIPRGFIDCGWGSGYVVIPKGHALHGKDYTEIHHLIPTLDVNGGLTFSESADNLTWPELPGHHKGAWVVGFDTAHGWNTLEMWPKEAVIQETERLKTQLMGFK